MNALLSNRQSQVLHIYDHYNMDYFNGLLRKENDLEDTSPIAKENRSTKGIWVVNLPFASNHDLSTKFSNAPLRFDSYVYAFFKCKIVSIKLNKSI